MGWGFDLSQPPASFLTTAGLGVDCPGLGILGSLEPLVVAQIPVPTSNFSPLPRWKSGERETGNGDWFPHLIGPHAPS